MKRVLLAFALLGTVTVFAQGHKVVGEVNGYSLVDLNGKLGVWDGETYMIEPGDYDRIEGDKEGVFFYAYKGNILSLFFNYSQIPVQQQLIAVKENTYDGWQLISTEGVGHLDHEMRITPPVFDKVTIKAEDIYPCCYNAWVEKNKKLGLYVHGNEILPAIYDKMEKPESYIDPPVLMLTKDKKVGVFQASRDYLLSGRIILPVAYDEVKFIQNSNLDGTFFSVKNELGFGIFGGYDSLFMVLPPAYKSIDWNGVSSYGHLLSVPVKSSEGSHQVLFSVLNPTFKPIYFAGPNATEEGLIVKNEAGKYGVISVYSDSYVIEPKYEMIQLHEYGYYAVKMDGKWGLLDDSGGVIVEIKYDKFSSLPEEIEH